jgi:His/Glu/Gln/Arg/opine family amino acid ABC transporter permease subunit
MIFALPLSGAITLVRVLRVPVAQRLVALYVSAMRGTPLLVQVFIVYYGLPSIGIEFSPITAGILALTLNVAAYMSESLRGSIQAVSQGQWLAGTSLGLTRTQTLRYVVGPQALRAAVPSLSNSLISLIKDTSLVSVIAVTGADARHQGTHLDHLPALPAVPGGGRRVLGAELQLRAGAALDGKAARVPALSARRCRWEWPADIIRGRQLLAGRASRRWRRENVVRAADGPAARHRSI